MLDDPMSLQRPVCRMLGLSGEEPTQNHTGANATALMRLSTAGLSFFVSLIPM